MAKGESERNPPFGVARSTVRMLVLRMFRTICPAVVLIIVNLLTRIVLLMVNLRSLLRRELAAVSRAVVMHFTVDVCFAILKLTGLMGRQLSTLCAILDTRLLIRFALVNSAHCRVRRPAMIFRHEIGAVGAGEMLV